MDEPASRLDRSIALQPHHTGSYYELGQIALDLQNDAAAKEAYMKALSSAPKHGGALTGIVPAFRAKEYVAAEDYLQQAVLYAPDYITAHRFYGMTLARLG